MTQHPRGTAISLTPAAYDAVVDDAIALHRAGRLDDAIARYEQALRHAPDDPEVLQRLGAALSARANDDDLDEAVSLLARAAEAIGPPTAATVGVHSNLGNALRRAKRLDEAEAVLREVVAVVPDDWKAWHNLGQVYNEQQRYDEAAGALRRSIALEPSYGETHAVLGTVLTSVGRLNAAVASLKRAIDNGCDNHQAYSHLGVAYRQLGRLAESEACFRRALESLPTIAPAHSNLAVVLSQTGQFEEAARLHARAVELDPDNVHVAANRAYGLLTAGDIPEAWTHWERGIQDGPRGRERETSARRWRGEDVSAETVMVYREQGVGDEILFASCYPDVVERARHVIIESDPRLVSLFARSFPDATARAQTIDVKNWRETLPEADFDVIVPAGSLPVILRRRLGDFPTRTSYLVADPARVDAWRERLAATPHPRVGISWRSKLTTAERRLEYTRLGEWAQIFQIPGVSFFNLQYDECTRELDDAERRFGITIHRDDDVDYMNDFETVAALMANLDLVIAPRNAVAMLAGALGVPTVMMGNRWDWSDLGTDTCPWLPSISLVYRHLDQEWDDVLAAAAARVAALI